jgi:exodeoxyribonuclease VIII
MQPGIYDGISNADYHGGAGVSKSMLDVLAERSPLHLFHMRTAANDNGPTAAQAIGTAFHALILEPEEFVKTYCLGLRQSDVPDAIESRDQLVKMVEELNKGRLPKLSASGKKEELAARIFDALPESVRTDHVRNDLQAASQAELKTHIETLNETRHGLLPTTGTMDQLAAILRENGQPVRLWKDVKAEWLANNGHRTVLEPEEWDQLHRMRDAVMAHPAARALLTAVPGRAEQSVYWVDEETGELCRCRPDFWREDGLIVDVKTTEDASPAGFAKSVANWRYHVQHPYYVDGVNAALKQSKRKPSWMKADKVRGFVFLAVEKSACVVNGVAKGVAVYVLDEDDAILTEAGEKVPYISSVTLGRNLYRDALRKYAACNRSGVWPGYGEKIQPLRVPAYEFTKHAQLVSAA